MKKLFSLVALAAMVSFAACSNSNNDEATTEMDSVQTEVMPEPTPEPVPVDTATTDTTTAPATEAAAH